MIKIIKKLGIIAILQVNIEVQHTSYVISRFNMPNEIPVVFHYSSSYDYHFVIKEFEG